MGKIKSMVFALRVAIRDDCGPGASKDAFFAACEAEKLLIDEIESLEIDAARYRWLRTQCAEDNMRKLMNGCEYGA